MIDPACLDELRRFDTRLNRRLVGRTTGEQATAEVGEGRTFSDYRRYAPGDDTRAVDWKLYARTKELYLRRFERERDLTMHLLVDATGSMDFGTGETHKFEYGAKLALGFAYLAIAEHNDVRFSIVTDSPRRLDSGRSTRGTVLDLLKQCNAVEPTGAGDIERALVEYAGSIRSRSLVLLVSDFLVDPDSLAAGLGAIERNDCTLAQVLTPAEREPPTYGETIFEGIEAAIRHRTYFGPRQRQRYQDRLTAHVDAIAATCDAAGARHVSVDTGTDFFESFARLWPE